MKLVGEIDIFGSVRFATAEIKESRKGKGVTFIDRLNKYKAYGYENGKPKFYGYYDTENDAARAAAEKRNYNKEARTGRIKKTPGGEVVKGITFIAGPNVWRVQMPLQGRRVSLGRYASYGQAVLARDVVARRAGKTVTVEDYEMPLGLISDPVVKSYITDRIVMPSPGEIAEYQRRVDILNENINRT